MSFKAPYISAQQLRSLAEDFLSQHNPDRQIPVPIERIVEVDFGMDIVPMPGLQSGYAIVAFITKDLQEIRIDEYVYLNRVTRYRFSLAHELAHRILHGDLWKTIEFRDIATWKAAVADSIPDDQYGFLEYHANCFAGFVLVPRNELRAAFFTCIELV